MGVLFLIGKTIKKLRTEKNITQSELANFLGLTPKMISFYELGERFPPYDIILKISDYFNVSTDYLLGKTAENNNLDKTCEDNNFIFTRRDITMILSYI